MAEKVPAKTDVPSLFQEVWTKECYLYQNVNLYFAITVFVP